MKKKKKPKRLTNKRLLGGVFDAFEEFLLAPEQIRDLQEAGGQAPEHVWRNSRYQVNQDTFPAEGVPAPGVTCLSIKRVDKKPIDVNHWRELQRIKNAICGPEREAVEIFPAESRLVDSSNQYYLWVYPEGVRLPFGFEFRDVVENPGGGAVQRRWMEDKPDDADDDTVPAAAFGDSREPAGD